MSGPNILGVKPKETTGSPSPVAVDASIDQPLPLHEAVFPTEYIETSWILLVNLFGNLGHQARHVSSQQLVDVHAFVDKSRHCTDGRLFTICPSVVSAPSFYHL